MRPSLDEYFMMMALVAKTRSTCPRRQVGAVLVDGDGIFISSGYNGNARGQPHCIDVPCEGARLPSGEGLDLCDAIHAEQNALTQCRTPRHARTIYCTTSPCVPCTKLLLNSTVQRIVFLEGYSGRGEQLWRSSGRAWDQLDLETSPCVNQLLKCFEKGVYG